MAATAPQDGVNETDPPASAETAILVAPLALPEKVAIGVVDFEALRDELKDEDTFKIVEAITAQAAQAIESVRLFEQTQAAREEAETLYKVGRALVTTEDETDIFNRVLQDMLATLGLKQGGILFLEPDRKFGRLVALFRDGQPVEPNLRIPIAGNPSYQKLIATRIDRDCPPMPADACWGCGSLAEARLLAPIAGLQRQLHDARAALALLVTRAGGEASFLDSTRRQLRRYVNWWTNENGYFPGRGDLAADATALLQTLP